MVTYYINGVIFLFDFKCLNATLRCQRRLGMRYLCIQSDWLNEDSPRELNKRHLLDHFLYPEDLDFADDTALLSHTHKDLQEKTD